MERHTENALKVAEYLKQHPKVKWVNYAGLSDHPQHKLAQKYVKGKPSAILSFGVQDGVKAVLVLLMHYNCLLVWSILVMPKVWHATLQPQLIAN
jgi:O-acetylhomoserine/O-acetylserine sulfhydrylase-like pyridoxal-dependent enzyme